jgi:hypothetical protein
MGKRNKVEYEVLVEGGLHDVVRSLTAARRLRDKFEAEGWNVRIVRYEETIFGRLGREVS